jgi:hypothetical protein
VEVIKVFPILSRPSFLFTGQKKEEEKILQNHYFSWGTNFNGFCG